MKDLKIGMKLLMGFSIILIFTLLIGVNGWNGINNVADRVEKADDVNRMVKSILEGRRQEKNFIIRKDEQYVSNVHQAVQDIYKQANETKEKFNKRLNKDQMDALIEKVENYEKSFDTYVESENNKNIVMEKMRVAAGEVIIQAEAIRASQKVQLAEIQKSGNASSIKIDDKILKADDANRIIKLFLNLRKNEKEIIISGEKEYYDAYKTLYENTYALANELTSRFQLRQNIDQGKKLLASLEAYKTNFDEFTELISKQQSIEKELVANAREAIDISNEARADQKEKMLTETSNTTSMIIGFALLALISGIIIAIIITKAITKPIRKGVDFANTIAEGDLSARLDIEQKDEIGDLSNALKKMVMSFQYGANMAISIAKGDLTVDLETNQQGNKGELAEALKQMVLKLREIVGNILSGAENIAGASQQLSSGSQQMSQGASEQASSTEEVSSSMEQMAANIQQNTENALQTEKIAVSSVDGIKRGNESASLSAESMKNIAEKIAIINDIAFQTNILALNAAVEAARAGEHGKGFAVVAAEVRKLAERSKVAAEEIDNVSKSGVKIAEEAGKQLEEIVPEIEKTAKLVQEISAASVEQKAGSDQINSAIQQLNQVTQENASSSEEMATSAEELSSQAEQLKEIVTFFKLGEFDIKKLKKEYKSNSGSIEPINIKETKLNYTNMAESEKVKIEMKNIDNDYETF